MSTTRPCHYSSHDGEKVKGTFHGWGNRIASDESNNVFPVKIAVIEREDGRVVEIPPGDMTFTDVKA